MKLFALEPEVAGGWGPGTVVTNSSNIKSGLELLPDVEHLEYRFDGWQGDELLTFLSTFIVTEGLEQAITQSNLTGFRFETVKITKSDQWKQWEQVVGNVLLPAFRRLIPLGSVSLYEGFQFNQWSEHDFCWGNRKNYKKPSNPSLTLNSIPPYCLVVSQRALQLISLHRIAYCEIFTFNLCTE